MKKLLTAALVCLLALGTAVLAACSDSGAKSITNLSYNGETITWSSVKNAKQYKIRIDDGAEIIVSQTEGTVSYNYDAKGADFDFSVEAVIKDGSDKNPTYSLTFTNIGQVQNLRIEDNKLKWDELESSESYEIMHNGNILGKTVGVNEYEVSAGAFKYRVRAVKGKTESVDGNNRYYSVWSDAIDGTVLDCPKNITYDSEEFRWDEVKTASGYIIKIGSEEFTSTANSYKYAAGTENFNISVKAVGNDSQKIYGSTYSEEKTYTYLEKIDTLNVEGGVLVWSPVENAVKYKIKIGGIVSSDLLTTNRYDGLQSGQSYRIQLLPIGTSDFYFSQWSTEITINILRSPAVGFNDNVIVWNEVSGCNGYEVVIEKDGSAVKTDSTNSATRVYSYPFAEAGEYSVKVKAQALTGGGVYESKYSVPFRVKRLAAPTNIAVSNQPLEQKQLGISFNPVGEADGYRLKANGAEIASITEGSSFAVDISNLTSEINESNVSFEVTARGKITQTQAILESAPSSVSVKKLATPQNVSINGRVISWSNVANTSKYVLTINGKRYELTTNEYTLTDVAPGAVEIYVQAMGNAQNVITGGYSNVLRATKLATPTNLNLNSAGLLSWDQVAGTSGYHITIGTQSLTPDTNSVNINSYLSAIIEGEGTQISVYARGDGAQTIDSDSSATKTLSKYARPANIQLSGDNLVWQGSELNGIPARSYRLYINDNEPVTLSATSYPLSNFAAGSFTVKVVTVGDYDNTLDSPQSDSFTFTKREKVANLTRQGSTFKWDAVPGASYEVKMGNAQPVTVTAAEIAVPFDKAGKYSVSIKVLGDDSVIADSDEYTFEQTVKALTTPVKDTDFTVEKAGNKVTVTVNSKQIVSGYNFIVSGMENKQSENVFEYIMTTEGASYTISVRLCGNMFIGEVFYIDSNPSAEITVING